MNEPRRFIFDPDVPLYAAIRAIVAALDDEGLALTQSDNARFSGITSVLVDGRKVVIVPAHRITKKEA